MTIKDVVITAATYLGMEGAVEYLEQETDADEGVLSAVNVLTRCVNYTLNELAANYIPMIFTERAEAKNGRIYLADLQKTPLKIISVTDDYGEKQHFTFTPEYLTAAIGYAVVEYSYIPSNYALTEEIGYKENEITPRVIALGAASEYCITERAFDDSVTFRQRFNDALSELCPVRNSHIKGRNFV